MVHVYSAMYKSYLGEKVPDALMVHYQQINVCFSKGLECLWAGKCCSGHPTCIECNQKGRIRCSKCPPVPETCKLYKCLGCTVNEKNALCMAMTQFRIAEMVRP